MFSNPFLVLYVSIPVDGRVINVLIDVKRLVNMKEKPHEKVITVTEEL